MRNLSIFRSSFPLLALILLFGCASKRNETRILLFTDNVHQNIERSLQEASSSGGWEIKKVSHPDSLTVAFMQEFSAVVTTFSSLNRLDHRGVTSLKRYLESGAGGVVAVKDTLDLQPGWPWLAAWNVAETKSMI